MQTRADYSLPLKIRARTKLSIMMNSFLLKLSDEQLSLINAENLEFQNEAAIENFFELKLKKGLISSEMISAAIDEELAEPLAKEILDRAERNSSTAKLVRDFRMLAHQAPLEYLEAKISDDPVNALQLLADTRRLTTDSAGKVEFRPLRVRARGMVDSEDKLLPERSPPPLRDSVLRKLKALDERNKDQRVNGNHFDSLLRKLKDLTTLRVGAPAFASLLVGIISTSAFYQLLSPRDQLPDYEYITRGTVPESRLLAEIEVYSEIVSENVILLQSGNSVQNGGIVAEGAQWTISALSQMDGTASLYSSEPDGTLTLLDTQPAYSGLYFTFSSFEVNDQSTLDLRITVIDEVESVEISYNLSYTVR